MKQPKKPKVTFSTKSKPTIVTSKSKWGSFISKPKK